MIRLILCVSLVIGGFYGGVEAEHFRGGYISWTPIPGQDRQVKLFFRLAYRNPFFSIGANEGERGEDCTAQAVDDETPVETNVKFNVFTTASDETVLFHGQHPYYTCTNIKNVGDDENYQWSSGFNETTITLPEQEGDVWDVGMTHTDSCCWIYLQNYRPPRRWYLRTTINLTLRSDLGDRPNSSPYVEGLPLKTVVQKCRTAISINAIDPDGDRLKCRWTNPTKGECEENEQNCGNPKRRVFNMQRNSCRIIVNAANSAPGLYAVAVIIEDFPREEGEGGEEPFSKISYQFLVNIIRSDVDCGRVVTNETSSCYVVPLVINPPFRLNLYAYTSNSSVEIVSIDMITPSGMEVSELIDDGNGHYHVEVSWVPSIDQVGVEEQLCYQARDEENIVGEEYCIRLFVNGTIPEPIPLISIPSSNQSALVHYGNQLWKLYFTEEVQLSEEDEGTVTFVFENGTVAREVHITSDIANVSTEAPNFFVQFNTPDFNLAPNTTYTIKLASGVVVGTKGCHVPSEEAEWSFTTDNLEQGRLPPAIHDPGVSVECTPTFMIAYVEKDRMPNVDPSILTYNDRDCYGRDHNETHVVVGTLYGKCGTRAVVNADRSMVSMINHIYLPQGGPPEYGDVLTRSDNFRVRVNCTIPTRRVTYSEFITNSHLTDIEVNATGNFNFSLRMFPDERYKNAHKIWNFPVNVQQNDRLYFEARTFSSNSRFQPFLEKCVATPAEVVADSLQYTLIEDGCPVDETVVFHESTDNFRRRFSVEAFAFIGYNLQSSIFVYCRMRNCNVRNGSCNTDCTEPEANSNRSKRSAVVLREGTVDESSDVPVSVITRKDYAECEDSISLAEVSMMCLVLGIICVIVLQSYLVAIWARKAKGSPCCANCGQKLEM